MKPQWFLRKRQWGKNGPANTDFFTTWSVVGIFVSAVVFACQN